LGECKVAVAEWFSKVTVALVKTALLPDAESLFHFQDGMHAG
jgi:hypothetical protein